MAAGVDGGVEVPEVNCVTVYRIHARLHHSSCSCLGCFCKHLSTGPMTDCSYALWAYLAVIQYYVREWRSPRFMYASSRQLG